MLTYPKRNGRGFTRVELLIIVSVLGIVAAVVMPPELIVVNLPVITGGPNFTGGNVNFNIINIAILRSTHPGITKAV